MESDKIHGSQKARVTRVINEFKTEVNPLISSIKEFHNRLLKDSEEEKSIQTQVLGAKTTSDQRLAQIEQSYAKIQGLYNELVDQGEGSESIESEVKRVHEELNKLFDVIEKKKDKYKSYYDEVFGVLDEDGKRVGGLKKEIEQRKKDLQELHNEKDKEYTALFDKIEGLLPGATSAGLAKAYQDQKQSYSKPYIIWSIVFVLNIVGMIVYAFLFFSGNPPTTLEEAVSRILTRLPFFIPAIWLGVFSSKQQSQSKRLQQEYAHKESSAKSYVGYRREIEKLGQAEENLEISRMLLKNMVDNAGYNPSDTLASNSHNDEPPVISKFLPSIVKKNRGEDEKK